MIDKHFKEHCEYHDPDLDLLIDAMLHPQKESAKRFLSMINDVMNYYMCRTDEEVRYPLLYIPASETWAQEVCIEFITLKLSLLYNNFVQNRLYQEIKVRNSIYYPERCSRREREHIDGSYRYRKGIFNLIENKNIPDFNENKNLIVCKHFNVSTPQNPYLIDICGDENTIGNYLYPISRADIHVDKLDKPIEDMEDICNIENIFVFLSRTANGRFSEAYSFQKPRITRLNKKNAGIKNVFYFYFSTKPYKLHRQLTWKYKNAVDILHEDVKDMKDFISLSSYESDYIFGRECRQKKLMINSNKELDEFRILVNDALCDCEYNVQIRNVLAICHSKESQDIFREEYGGIIEDVDKQYFEIFLKNISDIWTNAILPEIMSFMDGHKKVCLIIDDYFINKTYIANIVSLFASIGIEACVDSYYSLRYRRVEVKGELYNRIILLSYQGHYTGKPYNHYPNSFDPIYLKDGQKLLNIINTFVLEPYYSVHNYEYMKTLKNVLYSDYKNNFVKCSVLLPSKPKFKIEDSNDISITYPSNRSIGTNNSYTRFRAKTISGKTIRLTESDYVLCKENNEFAEEQIMTISSLNSLMTECDQEYLMYPLSNLQKKLEQIIENSETEIREGELYIRRAPAYSLTEDEIISESELWEILLRKKVEEKGADIVYKELMDKIPYSEQIKPQSFDRWYALDNDMILPRSRRMQDVLFKYLSLSPPYDKIIRRKKSQKSTKTEMKNSMLKSFLCNNLLSEDFKQSFEQLGDSIKDMLYLENDKDLESLIELLRKEIEYYIINSVSQYDKK